jgi:hypothetical protein
MGVAAAGHLPEDQGMRFLSAGLPEAVILQTLPLSKCVGDAPAQVRQRESRCAITAICGAQQREQRRVLVDWQYLTGAERSPFRRELKGESFDLTQERLRHGFVLPARSCAAVQSCLTARRKNSLQRDAPVQRQIRLQVVMRPPADRHWYNLAGGKADRGARGSVGVDRPAASTA